MVDCMNPLSLDMEYIRENMTDASPLRAWPHDHLARHGPATYVQGIINQVLEGREVGPFSMTACSGAPARCAAP